MKSFTFCFLLILLPALRAFAQPTVPASNMNFSSLDGGSFRVNWTNGNGARRIVIARQGSPVTATPVNGVDYNHSGTFGSGDAIAAGEFVVFDGLSSFVDVSGLLPSTTYHFAVYEYNGTGAATLYINTPATGSQATLSAPATQASALVFSNISGSRLRLDFTAGNGSRRIVLARQGGAVNANPADLSAYFASSIFGSGSQIGSGNYVVLNGTATNLTLTGLLPNTDYHFAVFEYNGFSTPVYLIPGATGSATTGPRPTLASSALSTTSIEGNSMRLNWSSGNGARRIVVARQGSAVTALPVDGTDYTANASFGAGDDLGGGQYVVFDGTASFVDITNLTANTVYHFRVYEYDGTGGGTAYLTASFGSASQSTQVTPTTQASSLVFSNLSGSTVTASWTNGNGSRRLVVVRQGAPVSNDPANYTFYSANAAFGFGNQIGAGNYVVYSNTGTSVNVTGLSINTTYHFNVYEFNGISGPVYLVPALSGSVTTPAQPTVAASNLSVSAIEGNSMRLNWVSGNGARRMVVARAGAAVTALPADGIDYNHNASFGSGDALAPGQFVVYDGTGGFVDISGLTAATVYHFAVFEYNGTGANAAYLTASFPSISQSTLSPPLTQASGINFTNIAGSTLTVNWVNGSGTRRLVLVREGGPVNADPSNYSTFVANPIFGSGSQIGTGNFAVSNVGAPTSVTVTGLNPGTTYYFAIYEYNGAAGPVYLTPGHTGSVTTAAQPTAPSTNMNFSTIEGNAMRVNWTSGNGARRIVVARAGSAVTATPVNGNDYTASNNFGAGDALALGQFVVFDGFTSFVDLTGLSPATTYHFAVFEYDGSGTSTAYLATALTGSQATVAAPTVQASNMTFTSVGATSLTVNWTNGNGVRRLVVARQGTAVNADPSNLVLYNASNNFGSGFQIGSGNYVVYQNTGSNVNVTGLTSGTTYHFAVYEFNGISAPVYLTPALTGNITTPGAPHIQATNATAASVSSTTMQINWTNGSGNRRLVLMKQGSAVDANPVNNTAYTANSFFGSGSQIGSGNYVVFDGVSSGVLVTNLQPNTSYHFAVFEYNSFGATSQFLLTSPALGNATTLGVLPVSLTDFRVFSQRKAIRLEWATGSEQNSARFEIEKSTDGMTFTAIGAIGAKGNSSSRTEYSFADLRPDTGNNFYRLRMVDQDGRFTYSSVLRINYQTKDLIRSYTNPVSHSITLQLTGSFNGEWRIYDVNGRLITQTGFAGGQIQADLSTVPMGTYVLEVQAGGRQQSLVFIKAANK